MKISISFDPKENLSDKQKIDFTKNVMKEMGIREDNHQYMITRHSDKKHDHHHILANRVGPEDMFLMKHRKKVIEFRKKILKIIGKKYLQKTSVKGWQKKKNIFKPTYKSHYRKVKILKSLKSYTGQTY